MPACLWARLTIAAANAPASASLLPNLIVSWSGPCLPANTMPPQCECAHLDGLRRQDVCTSQHAWQHLRYSANSLLCHSCQSLVGSWLPKVQTGTSCFTHQVQLNDAVKTCPAHNYVTVAHAIFYHYVASFAGFPGLIRRNTVASHTMRRGGGVTAACLRADSSAAHCCCTPCMSDDAVSACSNLKMGHTCRHAA